MQHLAGVCKAESQGTALRIFSAGNVRAAVTKFVAPFIVGIIALWVIWGVYGHRKFNCIESYKHFLEKPLSKELSPERFASAHRWALRVYDACEMGHLKDAERLYERLGKQHY